MKSKLFRKAISFITCLATFVSLAAGFPMKNENSVSNAALLTTYPKFKNVTSQVGLSGAKGFRVSISDFNNDNYPDIVVNYETNRYFYQYNPSSKTYTDISASTGVASGKKYNGCISADVDNDGDMDLFCFGPGVCELLTNNLKQTNRVSYSVSTVLQTSNDIRGAVFCDYNNDGFVDVFMTNYYNSNLQPISPILLAGKGNGTFTDVSQSAGINGAKVCGFAVSAFDYDNDNNIDLFAPTYANAATGSIDRHSILYRNNGNGTFTQTQSQANYDIFRGHVGQYSSFGTMPRDYDNDGDFDFAELIVHGDTNQGISPIPHSLVVVNEQSKFNWTKQYNAFDARYAIDKEKTDQRDQYGSWLDMNNDGMADFVMSEAYRGTNNIYLFAQKTDNTFELVNSSAGDQFFQPSFSTVPYHNVTPIDYDMDGDEDLLVGATDNTLHLLENVTTGSNHWVKIKLDGSQGGKCNASAIGAKVQVITPSKTYTQYIAAGNGQVSPQGPTILHFGLGTETTINAVKIYWPNASKTVETRSATVDKLNVYNIISDTTPPSAPTGLKVISKSNSAVSISWTASSDNSGIKDYIVYRNNVQIGTTSGTSFIDYSTFVPDSIYNYNVVARDNALNVSPKSSTLQVRILPEPYYFINVGINKSNGTATYNDTSNTFSLTSTGGGFGPGDDVGLHYIYRRMTGNGSITVRVTGLSSGTNNTGGIMLRGNMATNSCFAYIGFNNSGYVHFTRRAHMGVGTYSTQVGNKNLPIWLRITKNGYNVITYYSTDGTNWSQLASSDMTGFTDDVYVGMAAMSKDNSKTATVTFDNVNVVSTPNLPSPYFSSTIGTVNSFGSSLYENNKFTLKSSGLGFSVPGDQGFHYAWRGHSFGVSYTARIVSVDSLNGAMAGIMLRSTPYPDASFSFIGFEPVKNNITSWYRSSEGGALSGKSSPNKSIPVWVRINNVGNSVNTYYSYDKQNWTLYSSSTLSGFSTGVYIGMVVLSGDSSKVATAVFDDVTIKPTSTL